MNELLTNPWLFLTVVIWTICGIVSAIQKNENALGGAFLASILLGLFYIILHH